MRAVSLTWVGHILKLSKSSLWYLSLIRRIRNYYLQNRCSRLIAMRFHPFILICHRLEINTVVAIQVEELEVLVLITLTSNGNFSWGGNRILPLVSSCPLRRCQIGDIVVDQTEVLSVRQMNSDVIVTSGSTAYSDSIAVIRLIIRWESPEDRRWTNLFQLLRNSVCQIIIWMVLSNSTSGCAVVRRSGFSNPDGWPVRSSSIYVVPSL